MNNFNDLLIINIPDDFEKLHHITKLLKSLRNKGFLNMNNKLQQNVINNELIEEKTKKEIIKLLKINLRYRFLFKILFNKYRNYKKQRLNNTDLYLEDIKDLNDKQIININNKGNIDYHSFNSEFLIKLIIKNLTYQEDSYPYPQKIKNPYNNEILNKSQLICIFNQFKNKGIKYPLILQLFEKSNYSRKRFKYNFKNYLSELAIDNYVNKISDTMLIYYIKKLFIKKKS